MEWEEFMELAEENGFLWYCYGGVAVLATEEEQEKANTIKTKGAKYERTNESHH